MARDRFDCYELCVQSARHIVSFLHAAHGNRPAALREDFCGTAAVSRAWLIDAARRGEDARALAIDLDGPTLDRARELAAQAGVTRGLRLVRADALSAEAPDDPCDTVFVGNFSIGYIHRRDDLVGYLRRAHARLCRGQGGFGGGIFACDTYGGAGAFRLGSLTRLHPSRGREMICYHWAHESADPLTGLVENSISFRVELDGDVIAELPRAFIYRWRLWSIHELREAIREAGFASTEVYKDINVAPGEPATPVTDPRELGDDWIVMIVARTA